MRLRDIERVGVVQLSKADIVRHKLVQAIVRAYDDEAPEGHKKRRGH
jgi:phosphate starvation-inducible protein PhoH